MFNPSDQASVARGADESRFPTNGLKTLLKNSELLDLLLKPLNKPEDSPNIDTNLNDTNDLINAQLDIDFSSIDEPKSKSLFDWENSDEYLEMKAAKSNSDGDNSKIYGNAFLGQNLWDKTDLFQSEKFGVKFECLEIDEFLNENGLNETDVEFLDQLQKFENGSSASNPVPSNTDGRSSNSTGSVSPKSSSVSTPSMSPQSNIQNIESTLMNSNINMLHSASSSSASSISSSSSQANQASRGNYNQSNMLYVPGSVRNKQDGVMENKKSGSSRNSFDWNMSLNESSIDSISDDDEFETKMRKYSDEDFKAQPVLRKSKKFVPNELKDEKYWARRRKNNLAAKRSRDARRMKENQIAMRATLLERENDSLRKQLEEYKRETKLLKTKLARYESDVHMENPTK